METNPLKVVIQRLMADGNQDGGGMTDGELLTLFLSNRDDNALSALVWRHAPMVWGVCHRLLQRHHDAEDAFQATFLVLVRKAGDVPKQAVANWLYGVARQTAVRLRATAAKRGRREMQVINMPETSLGEVRDTSLQDVLDREFIRLPDHYRSVIVLCDLEGMTRQEAARQLAIPEGTVASRLARARAMLAKRLARHGLTVSGGALATGLTEMVASAVAPTTVVSSTIKVASLLATGKTEGVISVKVIALTQGVINAIMITKLKTITGVLVAVLAVATFAYGMMLGGQPRGGVDESDNPDRPEPRHTKEIAHSEQLTMTPDQKVALAQQKPAEPDVDWAVAEWVIANGGTVRTAAGTFRKGDPLGNGPFKITAISLGSTDKIKDDDLARFKNLTKLNNLSLANAPIGDAGLKHLAGLKSLESLYLPNTKVGNEGLAHLKGMTGLANLYLDGTKVTDAGLERLTELKGLSVLYLRHTQITDAGLKHIKAMPNLCWVDLWGTKVTDLGVKQIRAALPRCTIKNVDPRNDQPPPPANVGQPAAERVPTIPAVKKSGLPVGKWKVEFANGVVAVCEIGDGGGATVKEPRRIAKGMAEVKDGSVVITYNDDPIERWTPAGKKYVVEHWYPGAQMLVGAPILGIAEKAPQDGLPVGKWKVEFTNGVIEVCDIGNDGAASVEEPRRSAKGMAEEKDGSVVITYNDDRIERWIPIGKGYVVEHRFPASQVPAATPVLGIAEKEPKNDRPRQPNADRPADARIPPVEDQDRRAAVYVLSIAERVSTLVIAGNCGKETGTQTDSRSLLNTTRRHRIRGLESELPLGEKLRRLS